MLWKQNSTETLLVEKKFYKKEEARKKFQFTDFNKIKTMKTCFFSVVLVGIRLMIAFNLILKYIAKVKKQNYIRSFNNPPLSTYRRDFNSSELNPIYNKTSLITLFIPIMIKKKYYEHPT